MKRAPALVISLLLVTACTPRPGAGTLAAVAPTPLAQQQLVHVATSREPEFSSSMNFSAGRAQHLSFARYVISTPPGYQGPDIKWPQTLPPDPERHFAVLESASLTSQEFLDSLTRDRRPSYTDQSVPALPVEAYVFVHGYNTNYPESLMRAGQIVHDNPSRARAVLFAWPSDGALSGYVADKDAAATSRDQLAELLTLLTSDPRIVQVHLGAHSMGCWLAMESLRQLKLSGRDEVLRRLGSVVLAAPDIDMDVFLSQARVVGPLDPPIAVLTSPDDRALNLSNHLAGARQRLGSLDVDDERIQALAESQHLMLIDISSMAATDSLNHDKFLGAAASLQKVLGEAKEGNPLRRAGAFVLRAAASVLEVPGKISRAVADKAADGPLP